MFGPLCSLQAALSAVARTWGRPGCPAVASWSAAWCVCTLERVAGHREERNRTICSNAVALEGAVLSAVSQTERPTPWDLAYKWDLRTQGTKQKQTHRYGEQTSGVQTGAVLGAGAERGGDEELQTGTHITGMRRTA